MALREIETFRGLANIPKEKTWVMPAGDTREELIKMYPLTMEMCIREGYNFTGRAHIMGYQDKREV
jgi:7-carboxy-7-deazaguanine synthase